MSKPTKIKAAIIVGYLAVAVTMGLVIACSSASGQTPTPLPTPVTGQILTLLGRISTTYGYQLRPGRESSGDYYFSYCPLRITSTSGDGKSLVFSSGDGGASNYYSMHYDHVIGNQSSLRLTRSGSEVASGYFRVEVPTLMDSTLAFDQDEQVTITEESSGGGPFRTFCSGLTSNIYYGTVNSNAQTSPNSVDGSFSIGLEIPAECMGGTVVVHQIIAYFEDTNSGATIDDINIVHQYQGTTDAIITDTTDRGSGTTGDISVSLVSTDINRSTYPGAVFMYVNLKSESSATDILLDHVEVQWHIE